MKKVYSVKDIDDLHRSGALGSIPADAVITPSARDRLNELGVQRARRSGASPVAASAGGGSGDERGIDQSVRANSPKADLERLFNSPAVHELKEQICDVGRRLWQRAYVDGNGGNLSIRLTEDVVLCTPTLVSKGFMKPEDLCLVDAFRLAVCPCHLHKPCELCDAAQMLRTAARLVRSECEQAARRVRVCEVTAVSPVRKVNWDKVCKARRVAYPA